MILKNKRKMIVLVMALTTAAAIAFTGCSSSEKESASKTETSESSDLFSTMDTVDLKGNAVDSSVFAKNKVTLVNLWNVGCTPCAEEIPVLDKLNKEYEGKGAAILGLYYASPDYLKKERSAIEDILAKSNAEYTQLTLSQEMNDSEIIQNIQAFPTTFLVDSEGNIIDQILGSNDYDGWKEVIENALEKAAANE